MHSKPCSLLQMLPLKSYRNAAIIIIHFADEKTEEWRLIFKIIPLQNRERKIPRGELQSQWLPHEAVLLF